MKHSWRGLDIKAEGSGISEPLSEQVNLLGTLCGHAIRRQAGQQVFDDVEKFRYLCKKSRELKATADRDKVFAAIKKLSTEQLIWLIRSYSAFFHLVNQAEQEEIIRINRERSSRTDQQSPRSESILDAFVRLKNEGFTAKQVESILNELDVQPTFTAHPTEARRRSILYKQQDIARQLRKLHEEQLIPQERENIYSELYQQIELMLATDELRSQQLTVKDEVQHGLYFCKTTLWEVIPRIYQDIVEGMETVFGTTPELSSVLRYCSWIGGDRDGNPNVTPEITQYTLEQHRQTILSLYRDELVQLHRELSISIRYLPDHDAVKNLSKKFSSFSEPENEEPFRGIIREIITKIDEQLDTTLSETPEHTYSASDFIDDLNGLHDLLSNTGMGDIAKYGRLGRLLVRARIFGFHLTTLDIRQHSEVHESAVAEMFAKAGITDDYANLPEEKRLEILSTELANPRPLLQRKTEISEDTHRTLQTFKVIRRSVFAEPHSIRSYIISMTHDISDILEVLLLAKEVGLCSLNGENPYSLLDIVPLFETIDDLENGHELLNRLFNYPAYKKQLELRGSFQEIMLGYSDSNKDGGYWMANWALHKAEQTMADACRKSKLKFRFFHGRGGTVGRGGGRANQAILALPAACHNGRIRFTEQGEVITFRYASTAIAHRHLEQIMNAMILSTARSGKARKTNKTEIKKETFGLMEQIASESMEHYRGLVRHPDFWDWYSNTTPVRHISELRIASRPVSRAKGKEMDLDSIRAIPWNFAWTQTRFNVPGWYGIGTALKKLIPNDEKLEVLKKLYEEWPFLRAIINNAQREMARSELSIGEIYHNQFGGSKHALFYEHIKKDFADSREMILSITGQKSLLDNSPVIQKSIRLRNPYTDVLNLIQITLMQRWQDNKLEEPHQLGRGLLLSLNGLAAAMQSTG